MLLLLIDLNQELTPDEPPVSSSGTFLFRDLGLFILILLVITSKVENETEPKEQVQTKKFKKANKTRFAKKKVCSWSKCKRTTVTPCLNESCEKIACSLHQFDLCIKDSFHSVT